jgi:hypothetical protein
MIRFMRKPALLAMTLLVTLGLAGCTAVGSLADKAAIDLGLASLSSQLEEVPGVTEVTSTAEVTGDYHYTIALHATAVEVSDADLFRVATLVSEEFGKGVFTKEQVQFDLAVPKGGLLGLSVFDLDAGQLEAELDYRSALSKAYGEVLGMSLSPTENGTNYDRRILTLVTAAAPDWDAMRAVPDPSTAERQWALAGLSDQGSLPNPALGELADALNAITPLDGDAHFGLSAAGGNVFVELQVPAKKFEQLTTSNQWPWIGAVAGRISEATFATASLSVNISDSSVGLASAHYGDCTVVPVLAEDAKLADALGAGWQPGWCAPTS